MRVVALNIETQANLDLLDQLETPEVKLGRMTDPEKIRLKKEEAAKKAASSMALCPFYGKVLCISLATRKSADQVKALTVFSTDKPDGEKAIIEWLWKQLRTEPTKIVTFNGAGFDLPYLYLRGLQLGVDMPPAYELGKYQVNTFGRIHVDLMQAQHQLYESPTNVSQNLSFYGRILLKIDWPFPDVDQSHLGHLILQEGGRQIIQNLCEWNTKTALALFELLSARLP